MSGANLSDVYFQQRQDRYLLIKDKPLCDALAATALCLSASPAAALIFNDDNSNRNNNDIKSAQSDSNAVTESKGALSKGGSDCGLESIGSMNTQIPPFWLAHSRPFHNNNISDASAVAADWSWLSAAPALAQSLSTQSRAAAFAAPGATARALQAILGPLPPFTATATAATAIAAPAVTDATAAAATDTVIYPSLQLASLGVRQDERLFTALMNDLINLTHGNNNSFGSSSNSSLTNASASAETASASSPAAAVSVHIATGYFNMPPPYQALVARLVAPVSAVSAAVAGAANAVRVLVASKQVRLRRT